MYDVCMYIHNGVLFLNVIECTILSILAIVASSVWNDFTPDIYLNNTFISFQFLLKCLIFNEENKSQFNWLKIFTLIIDKIKNFKVQKWMGRTSSDMTFTAD
jgi:hypothetical protein